MIQETTSMELVTIESLIDSYKKIVELYENNLHVIKEMNENTQDLLHEIEFGKPKSSPEICSLYKELRRVREVRRMAKKENELIQPLYNFITADNKLIYKLDEIKGEIRKINNRQKNATYTPRQRTDLTLPHREVINDIQPQDPKGLTKRQVGRQLRNLRRK